MTIGPLNFVKTLFTHFIMTRIKHIKTKCSKICKTCKGYQHGLVSFTWANGGHNLISTILIVYKICISMLDKFLPCNRHWPNHWTNWSCNLWDFFLVDGSYKGILQGYVCVIKPLHFLRSFFAKWCFCNLWLIYLFSCEVLWLPYSGSGGFHWGVNINF